MIRRHLSIHGLVQGVSYRVSTGEQARRLGLTGWIMNRPDGSVEAEIEGPSRDVEAMVDWCRRGPPAAAVSTVDVTELAPTGEPGFDVR